MRGHSSEFTQLRDALLELEDADRRRLIGLFGCMADPRPPALSLRLIHVLDLFTSLDPDDRRRFERWFAAYVSRWGQVPLAAVRKLTPPRRQPPPKG